VKFFNLYNTGVLLYRGADISLARPGRKQATATKLARRLTCFLLASVTRKDLQFGTWTDPFFQRHYRFRPTTWEVGRAKDLSALLYGTNREVRRID